VKKRGLGKGLDALLSINTTITDNTNKIIELDINSITTNKYQPRINFDDSTTKELANSIQNQGLLQPVVVRKTTDHQYELIAGERRLRACKSLNWQQIPAIVKQVTDTDASLLALIENIQREDLNPLEQAQAFYQLQHNFSLTQQQIADAVGKSRSNISNLLRLLELADEVKPFVYDGILEMGHARALLSLDKSDQLTAAKIVQEKQLNVRQTEQLIRNWHNLNNSAENKEKTTKLDSDLQQIEQLLSHKINLPVQIKQNKQGKGKLVINYDSLDNLRHLLNLF